MYFTYTLTHKSIKLHGRYDKADPNADQLLVCEVVGDDQIGIMVGDRSSDPPVDVTRWARSSAITRSPTA